MNTGPYSICSVVGSGGVGGTQKAAALYASELARRGHRLSFLCTIDGPWSRFCREQGVNVFVIPWTADALAATLENIRPDIVHHHTPGYDPLTPLYGALARVAPRLPVRVIETNIFARFDDPVGDAWLDHRLFVSMSSGVQAHLRAGRRRPSRRPRESVVFYPVSPCQPITAARRDEVRSALGVAPDDVLALRLGRPDAYKWADWDVRAFRLARRKTPRLRLLLMEPPAPLRRRFENLVADGGLIIRGQLDDAALLEELNLSADVLLHAPPTGEGFGFTLAEAMAAGLPVVTRSTPYSDNAQGELVDDGVTGFVCGSISEMGRRLVALAQDSALRRAMGAAGRDRILSLAGTAQEIDVLESVLREVMTGSRDGRLARRDAELEAYFETYRARLWRLSDQPLRHPLEYAWTRLYAFARTHYNAMRAWQYRRGRCSKIREDSWPPPNRLHRPTAGRTDAPAPSA